MNKDLENIEDKWIYQSNVLIESSYSLTVLEQKVLRILASMIKKDDIDFKEYKFTTKDLMQVMNIKNKRFYNDLDNLTDLLMKRIIKIKNKENNEFEKYHFLDVAKYKNGILTLKIHPELKPFYLNLDWYSKYQLGNIMQFKSTYSFRFYELLKQYQNLNERILTVDDLRFKLDIGKKEYPMYANLKQKVIKPAINEINKKTDLRIEVEEIKEIRKVKSIKFYIKSNKKVAAPKAIDEITATTETHIETIEQQIEKVKKFTNKDFTDKAITKFLEISFADIDKIKKCYEYMKTKEIKTSKTGYMNTLLKNFEEPETCNPRTGFNNFAPRKLEEKYIELRNKVLCGQASEQEIEEFNTYNKK